MPRILQVSIETNVVQNCLELFVNHDTMRVDRCPSQRSTAKEMASQMESLEVDVLDDCCARAGVSMGG